MGKAISSLDLFIIKKKSLLLSVRIILLLFLTKHTAIYRLCKGKSFLLIDVKTSENE